MKLSSDETRAVAFVLGLVALAGIARFVTLPRGTSLPPGEALDAAALEDSSEAVLERERAAARPLGAAERIDVNGAGVAELDRLPGVGPALAQRIVEERERGGAFDSATDLRAVPGLGRALLARLEPHLEFGSGAGLSRRSSSAQAQRAEGESGGGRDGAAASGRSRRVSRPVAGRSARDAADAGVSRSPALPLSPTAFERLDLNRATAAQLEALPGIGPSLAARIVARRDSVGGFREVGELLAVRGIGPATLARLRPYFRE